MKEDTAFHRCTECLQSYKLINTAGDVDDNICNNRKRMCHFITLLFRDLLLALVVVNLFIVALAFFTYSIDNSSKALITTLKLQHYPVLFYYSFGLTIGLCIVGVMYLCTYFKLCPNDCGNSMICPDTCFYGPFYYTSPETSTGLCGGNCCCESCSGCSGAECAACEMNEICIVAVITVFVIFVLIGAFVCVFLGVIYVQKLVSEHAHVLHKFTLAKDFIVADLASDSAEDSSHGTELDPEHISLLGLRTSGGGSNVPHIDNIDFPQSSMIQSNSMSRDDFVSSSVDGNQNSSRSRFLSLSTPRGYVSVEDDIELSLPSSHSSITNYQSGFPDGRAYDSKVYSPTITKRF